MKQRELEALARLQELIKNFEQLDTDLLDNLKAENWEALGETIKAKREIKRFLADRALTNVGQDLAVKLKMIRDNYGYNIDKAYEVLEQVTGERVSQEDEEGLDWVDALFSKGTADYVDEHFYRRHNEVGSIIASQSLPDHLLKHLKRLKECYALGLFEATVIFCRAVIEVGLYEALRRKEKKKPGNEASDFGKRSLSSLMLKVKPFVYEYNHQEAKKVIGLANDILHKKDDKVIVHEHEAYNAIKTTFAIIEELFK